METNENTKTFKSGNGLIEISRGDYFSFPCQLAADEFDDEKMQKLADNIGTRLERDYRVTKEELDDFNNDEIQDLYWKTVEDESLDLGMRYAEDIDDFF